MGVKRWRVILTCLGGNFSPREGEGGQGGGEEGGV